MSDNEPGEIYWLGLELEEITFIRNAMHDIVIESVPGSKRDQAKEIVFTIQSFIDGSWRHPDNEGVNLEWSL